MKKILSLLIVFMGVSMSVLADNREDAVQFFNSYVKAANSYSPTVAEMYSPKARIIRQVIKPDGTTQNVETNTSTYITQMKIGQAGAKLRHYSNSYTNINAVKISDNKYKVTSLRQPSGESYKLKTYMVVEKQPSGKWLIVEELMQTKEQIFLKYAKKA